VDETLPDDPRCLATTDALVIDGANGICLDRRIGSAEAGSTSAAALLAASVLAALVLLRLEARTRTRAALAVGSLAALPGWYALATRADAPQTVGRTSAEIAALHDALRDHAQRHGCARVRDHACVACEPIARLALSGLACERAAEIDLREGALGGRCVAQEDALFCGASP
jgi:hypothetical protein